MDILLLAPAGPDPRAMTPLGERRLEGLVTAFVDRGEFVRLYAYVPADEAALRWLLDAPGGVAGIARRYGLEASAIVPAARLTTGLLEALHARGILDVVLTASGRAFAEALAAIAVIDGHHGRAAAPRSGRALSFRLWLEPGDDGEDHRRLALLGRRAPWLAVEAPAFDVPAAPPLPASELPEELRGRRGGCWLFDLSLTVDGDGRVRMCPRHAEVEEGVVGDLFLHTPEDLLGRKRDARSRVGTNGPCRRCGVRGRFQWPEPERDRPAVAPAATAAAAAPAPPAGLPETLEVDAGDPEAAARALADFEARLEAWSASLESWEDGDA